SWRRRRDDRRCNRACPSGRTCARRPGESKHRRAESRGSATTAPRTREAMRDAPPPARRARRAGASERRRRRGRRARAGYTMYVAKMPDRRWAPPLLGAAATGLLMVLDRGRAHGSGLESLVHDSASNIGDPWPSVVAARRLLDAWHAPIYADFSDAGSSFIYPPLAALPYSPFAHASYEGAHAGI